jgi:hypothetical protein
MRNLFAKARLVWILLGPEELVALVLFLATVAVWAATIGALLSP